MFLANYDPKVMTTPSKRISPVIQAQETLLGSSRKREKHKDEEKGPKKKDQVPLEKEKMDFVQGKEDEGPTFEIIQAIGSKKTGKRMKGRKLVFTQETIEKDMPGNLVSRSIARNSSLVSEYLHQTSPRIFEPQEDDNLQQDMHHQE